MIGVSEKDLDAKFFENILGDRFDRGGSPDGHEHRRGNLAVGNRETAQPGSAGLGFNLE